jgi:aminopeptidase N
MLHRAGQVLTACLIVLLGVVPSHAAPPAPGSGVLPAEVKPIHYDIRVTPDARALTFAAEVYISVQVRQPVDRIVLNAADLAFDAARLSDVVETPAISLDAGKETATFVFREPLVPGFYSLFIRYRGKINQQYSGLFAVDYDSEGGTQRALFTQFQNADARRFVPSWDEPAAKAVFSLTVTAPKGQLVVSNMPSIETTYTDTGLQRTRFAESPPMSSYLLFLAMGDLERLSMKAGPVDVGIVARRGASVQGRFALESAAKLIPYYNQYFDAPYPLPKLDLVAVPGESSMFSAMENWGASSFTESVLLLSPEFSTEGDKQGVFITVAHEVAHQWFGNLVTMAWWDDLWLNEGFASWMEGKVSDHFHPEWKVGLFTRSNVQDAIGIDAKAGTHPVITPIADVFQAAGAFDSITYDKGRAVVAMLEAYLGADVFRAGVAAYVKKYAYKNTVSDDLWASLESVSAVPVREIAHDFTLQAGVPLIRVGRAGGALTLSQGRYTVEEPPPPAQTWRIPVVVQGSGGGPWRGIVAGRAPTTVQVAAVAGAIVNAGQVGYFRTAYAPELWPPIVERFAALSNEDQYGLLNDSFGLGLAGEVKASNYLDLAAQATPDMDPEVLQVLRAKLVALDNLYEDLPGRAAFREFARLRLKPVLERLSWDPRTTDTDNEAVLRGSILLAMASLGDVDVAAEAQRRFTKLLADPSAFTGTARRVVLRITAEQATPAQWEQIHGLAKAATDPAETSYLYDLLGASRDPALADKTLALALSAEPPATARPGIISAVGNPFPEKSFEFFLANRAAVDAMLEPNNRWSYIANLASGSQKLETADRLTAFAAAEVPETARGDFVKAIAGIRYSAKIRAERLPDVDRWLASNGE